MTGTAPFATLVPLTVEMRNLLRRGLDAYEAAHGLDADEQATASDLRELLRAAAVAEMTSVLGTAAP